MGGEEDNSEAKSSQKNDEGEIKILGHDIRMSRITGSRPSDDR